MTLVTASATAATGTKSPMRIAITYPMTTGSSFRWSLCTPSSSPCGVLTWAVTPRQWGCRCGELGEPFGFLFEGMRMDRVAGTTVLTGSVIDQAHLLGLIQRAQELGLELISVQPADERSDETERPAS